MKKNRFNFLQRKGVSLFAIFFLCFLFSCKKDGELSPNFDNANLSVLFTDTFSLNSTVIQEDSLRTDLAAANLLGLYNDPIFGPMSSSIYGQVTLTGLNVDFESTSSTLDSIVLTLDYLGIYGDTASPISINVYELNEEMLSSNAYYSNSYIAHNGIIIGTKTFVPNLSDSVNLEFKSETKKPHLRIKLTDPAFLDKIFKGDASGANKMENNSDFVTYMKGLYITTVDSVTNTSLMPGAGSIASFDMNSNMSTLTVYYNDSLSYNFTINNDGVKYSRFAHNYSGTDIESHLNQLPTRDTTLTYVSTMAGVKTKLMIPNIKDLLSDGNIVINKAELVITLENGTMGNFDNPLGSISLTGVDANGDPFFLPDLFEGIDIYGGNIDLSSNTYTYNISRHINDLVYNTTTDYGLFLIANGALVTTGRSVLGTNKNVISKMKLNLTYSKL